MLIQTKNLNKTYGTKYTMVNALRDVSLMIEKGEFVALIGPSGCGKSTLLHVLGAMDTPDKGEILLEGNNILKLKSRKLTNIRLNKIGFIFQTFNLIPTLTSLENVMLPMKLAGVSNRAAKEKAKRILEKMGLSDRLKHIPAQLSGGQKQRVAIARALANDPAIILADEPTGNLDSASGEIIMNLLQEIHKDGNTIIMVTHNPELAERAGKIIRMKDGVLVDNFSK